MHIKIPQYEYMYIFIISMFSMEDVEYVICNTASYWDDEVVNKNNQSFSWLFNLWNVECCNIKGVLWFLMCLLTVTWVNMFKIPSLFFFFF